MKHNYITGFHPHTTPDDMKCYILWYRTGGIIRGELHFRLFDTAEEAKKFCRNFRNFKKFDFEKS